MPTSERKEWRRKFADTIMELAKGEADILQAASWAIEAQYKRGSEDPVSAATDEYKNGTPPTPD